MKKVILSYAVGEPHKEMYELTLPSRFQYAEKYNYDLVTSQEIHSNRPKAWEKIGLMKDLLEKYDEVLFLGCDVLIVDQSIDLVSQVPVEAWQALVVHDVETMPGSERVGYVPNTDVWLVRKPMISILEEIENLSSKYLYHPWWEQAALMSLMGFNTDIPCLRQTATELWTRTYELDARWNYHYYAKCLGKPYFKHATGFPIPTRINMIKDWLKESNELH